MNYSTTPSENQTTGGTTMNFSLHTIGLRKQLRNINDYYDTLEKLYNNACGRYKVFPDTNGYDHHATIFQGRGIRVILRKTKVDGYLIFIVSLNDLLGAENKLELITPENLKTALDTADEMLVGEFGRGYSIDELELFRVDQCINVDVESEENVREYIMQLYRSDMKLGYKVCVPDTPDFSVTKGFTARNLTAKTEISFYDKQSQLEQRSYDPEPADGILRVELRLLTKKTVERYSRCCGTNRTKIVACMNNSRESILDTVKMLLIDADYYSIRKACSIVKKKVKNEKKRERMLEMLRLTRKHFSVVKAKKKLFKNNPHLHHDYFDKMMEEFREIGVNVVTLDKYSEVKFLPSLFKYLS